MNYIISESNNEIKLNIEKKFAEPYFGILLNAAQQGAFAQMGEDGERARRFIESVALKLGMIKLADEMEPTPDIPQPPPQFTQTVYVNGQPVNV